ncbi:Hint domain-containing protein [Paracoccus alcaliphilus]|uniref:Hint domain-containing protein n=1 Tax=Paracoccus alcaliphilus TaxID=34002 RepID=A0A1H8NBJ4_9RHOB|nr:Hint domain-containing protein [Paracoccus alcaliphilus]WCR18421.1 Hint domain-containing protein [Paracoccus alcaliphilus]SEO26980.1 Hint domain-containing protein [Paracoccus alcaliphilus]
MPINFLLPIIPIDAFTFTGGDAAPETYWQDGQGDSWDDNGTPPTFSFAPGSMVPASVYSEREILSDDPTWGQHLEEGITLDGVTWPAGHTIELEYSFRVTDENGTEFRVNAISINAPGQQTDTIVGFTFEAIAPEGYEGKFFDLQQFPNAGSELTYVPGSAVDRQKMMPHDQNNLPCFTRGTMILTDAGLRAIEDLAEGDLVMTRDNGLQPVRWIGSVGVSADRLAAEPTLRPIRIAAGALGASTPAQDLLVSPQHRVLVRSRIAQRMFGTSEVLVAAKQLLTIEGVDIADAADGVEYFHMLFDRHEVVFSNGAETESLYTGAEALKAVGSAAKEEIFALFPELRDSDVAPQAARILASGRQGRKLAMRHLQNSRALVN